MLLCLTANHRNAGFDLLERLAASSGGVGPAMVRDVAGVNGAVLLATCNRFEAYLDVDENAADAAAGKAAGDIPAVSAALVESLAGLDVDELRDSLTVLSGDAVPEHLFAVSSGLESVVVGEGEIAGQVRRALETARAAGTSSTELERLFQQASRASREVKTRTGIGAAGRSLVRLSLDLASSRIPDWRSTKVLLIGTGAYAGASLAALRDRGVTDIAVYSPSDRAAKFAARHGIAAVSRGELLAAAAASAVIVTCSTARHFVIDAPIAAEARALAAPESRQLIIDLGLPRNVDPEVAAIPGLTLLDLETISLHAPLAELNSADEARAIVDAAAAEYEASRAEKEIAPAVVALRTHLFSVLEDEIERARSRGDSSAETEQALRHLVSVLVHTPSERARGLARAGEGARFTDALDALFGLAVQPEAEQQESDHRRSAS